MSYLVNKNIISKAITWCNDYANGNYSDIPVSIRKGKYIRGETSRGWFSHESNMIKIFEDKAFVYSHEFLHASDSAAHPDWFSYSLVKDKASDIANRGITELRKCNYNVELMTEAGKCRYLAYYLMSPIELRAVSFSVLYGKEVPPYISDMEKLISYAENFNDILDPIIIEYTTSILLGRYNAFMRFMEHKTEESLIELFEFLENDIVFQKYHI